MIQSTSVPPEECESLEELRKSAEKARELAIASVDNETVEHLTEDAQALEEMADNIEGRERAEVDLLAPEDGDPTPSAISPVPRKRAPLRLKWQ